MTASKRGTRGGRGAMRRIRVDCARERGTRRRAPDFARLRRAAPELALLRARRAGFGAAASFSPPESALLRSPNTQSGQIRHPAPRSRGESGAVTQSGEIRRERGRETLARALAPAIPHLGKAHGSMPKGLQPYAREGPVALRPGRAHGPTPRKGPRLPGQDARPEPGRRPLRGRAPAGTSRARRETPRGPRRRAGQSARPAARSSPRART